MKFSKLTEKEINEILLLILRRVEIIDDRLIPIKYKKLAYDLTIDIDINDFFFVLLSLYLDAKLWTGDKKLCKSLHKKGYEICLTTTELKKF